MSTRYFCDLCPRETTPGKDMFVISFVDSNGKPVKLPYDVCAFCKEKIIAYIEGLKK
ncbi:MAG: hypothetical protein ABFC84_16720 [Veillonellales bacterium]